MEHRNRTGTGSSGMAEVAAAALRVGVGAALIGSGALKLLPGATAADELAGRALQVVSSGLLGPAVGIPVLAACECAAGAAMIRGRFLAASLALVLAQAALTMLPLFFFPEETLAGVPHAAAGYTLRSLALVGAGVLAGATARVGAAARPALARERRLGVRRIAT
jgi:hypothetical protein